MFAFVHKMCTCLCLCVSVLCLTRLSDSGSQWYCSRSMRLSPGGCSVCHAMFPCARVCLISNASECLCAWGLTRVCVCLTLCLWLQVHTPLKRCMPDLSHHRLPGVPFLFQWASGFHVTMITFTSTIKSRRTQITVTHRGTPLPHLLDPDEIWWQDLLSSALP